MTTSGRCIVRLLSTMGCLVAAHVLAPPSSAATPAGPIAPAARSATLPGTSGRIPALVGSIAGRITDAERGQALVGVTVSLEGTVLRAITDAEGRYALSAVPAGTHTLVARRIGYASQRQTVAVADNQRATADFSLVASNVILDEVIVTGTVGGETRRSIGNSVATINAEETMELSGTSDVGSLINARAPGVIERNSSLT